MLPVCVLRDVGGAQSSGVLLPVLSSLITWASEVPESAPLWPNGIQEDCGLVLAFIHPEVAHVLGMVPGDSCPCGRPTQVHKQSPCGLVGARMEEVWGL